MLISLLMTGKLKPQTKQSEDAHIFTTTCDLYVITISPSYFSSLETWKHWFKQDLIGGYYNNVINVK